MHKLTSSSIDSVHAIRYRTYRPATNTSEKNSCASEHQFWLFARSDSANHSPPLSRHEDMLGNGTRVAPHFPVNCLMIHVVQELRSCCGIHNSLSYEWKHEWRRDLYLCRPRCTHVLNSSTGKCFLPCCGAFRSEYGIPLGVEKQWRLRYVSTRITPMHYNFAIHVPGRGRGILVSHETCPVLMKAIPVVHHLRDAVAARKRSLPSPENHEPTRFPGVISRNHERRSVRLPLIIRSALLGNRAVRHTPTFRCREPSFPPRAFIYREERRNWFEE